MGRCGAAAHAKRRLIAAAGIAFGRGPRGARPSAECGPRTVELRGFSLSPALRLTAHRWFNAASSTADGVGAPSAKRVGHGPAVSAPPSASRSLRGPWEGDRPPAVAPPSPRAFGPRYFPHPSGGRREELGVLPPQAGEEKTVELRGFEPLTPCMPCRCSAELSYSPEGSQIVSARSWGKL